MTKIIIALIACVLFDLSNPITSLGKTKGEKLSEGTKKVINLIATFLVCFLAVTSLF